MKVDVNPDPASASQLSDRALSALLDLDDRSRVWHECDLAKVLRHQLDTPIGVDLGLPIPPVQSGPTPGHEGRTHSHVANVLTFGQLFDDHAPPLELLVRVKDFAKGSTRAADGSMPEEVGAVIYYLSIVVARLRCDERISGLSDADLEIGLRTALGWPWLDDRSRATLATGLGVVSDGRRND